jgi:hypothetical protein
MASCDENVSTGSKAMGVMACGDNVAVMTKIGECGDHLAVMTKIDVPDVMNGKGEGSLERINGVVNFDRGVVEVVDEVMTNINAVGIEVEECDAEKQGEQEEEKEEEEEESEGTFNMRTHTHVHTFTQKHTHTHTHRHTRRHTHTHAHTQVELAPLWKWTNIRQRANTRLKASSRQSTIICQRASTRQKASSRQRRRAI